MIDKEKRLEEIKEKFILITAKINSGKLIITPDELIIMLGKTGV